MKYTFTSVLKEIPKQNRTKDADQEQYLHEARNNANLTYSDIVHFRKFHELTSRHVTGNYVVSLNSSEQMKYENSQAAFLLKAFIITRSQEKNIILEDFMKMVNIYREIRSSSLCDDNPLGLVARKPVFGVSDKVRFKPACSATETS